MNVTRCFHQQHITFESLIEKKRKNERSGFSAFLRYRIHVRVPLYLPYLKNSRDIIGIAELMPSADGDMLSPVALENAYATCHNVQDLLHLRGFTSKPSYSKIKKVSSKNVKKGKGWKWYRKSAMGRYPSHPRGNYGRPPHFGVLARNNPPFPLSPSMYAMLSDPIN